MVHVLYGEKWMPMVPVLELLSIAAVPQILCAATGGAYRAAGCTGLLFRVGVAGTILTALAIVAGLPWGIIGVATTFLINCWILVPVALGRLARVLGLPLKTLVLPVIRGWGPAAATGAGELLVRVVLPKDLAPWEVLVLQLAVGALIYLAMMWRSDSEVATAAKARLQRFITVRQRTSPNTVR